MILYPWVRILLCPEFYETNDVVNLIFQQGLEALKLLFFYEMPQLDKASYLSQSFWLWFFFIGFFFVILMFILPKLSRILKIRREALTRIYHSRTGFFKESSNACLHLSSACVLDSLDINKNLSDVTAVRMTEKTEIQSLRKNLLSKCASFFAPFHQQWGKKFHTQFLMKVELDLAQSLNIFPGFSHSEKSFIFIVLNHEN